MTPAAIEASGLGRSFTVAERDAGLRSAVGVLVRRRKQQVHALQDVGIRVEPGEIVGILGANGAGKTTLLKLLSGLLHPSAGSVRVLGHDPARREPAYLRRMALVMGNRYQLQWDLPAVDSFELNRAIYRIPRERFRQTRDELVELLDLGDLVRKPVRNLSLGERMKMELVGSLLHRPEMLFLDEPTLGLDVAMQRRIRTFVAEYNRTRSATVLLTSHYMADIEALCQRVVVVHCGRVLYDGDLSRLGERFAAHRDIEVTPTDPGVDLSGFGECRPASAGRLRVRVEAARVPEVTTRLLAGGGVTDLTVTRPAIEDVIEHIFTSDAVDLRVDGADPAGRGAPATAAAP
ncbi:MULTISPECIES: ABC transporter ATP-binding protein [Kitasatospora]|uniref:ATP-binding cassette domain-containing protein n=1 Tax=Kitasatospora cystarginea TaxID=58350 RepID=A0ABN3DRN5_9ACTN